MELSPSSPPDRPLQQFRWAWWLLGVTALVLLVLQAINWTRGKGSLPPMLNPIGLLFLSSGSLLSRQPLRMVLICAGVLLMLVAIVWRYMV